MARQFREQLEEEVQLEEARKAQRAAPPPEPEPEPPPPPTDPAPPPVVNPAPPMGEAAASADPPLPPTFSHAHPTDATGADTTVRPGAHLHPDEPGT